MFDANQQPMTKKENSSVVEQYIIDTAKLRADMEAAIAVAPTSHIISQLQYRLKHKVYKYDDLVDPKLVNEQISKPLPEHMKMLNGAMY